MATLVYKNGQQLGPFEDAEIQAHLESGRFLPSDFAWKPGMAGWAPLREIAAGTTATAAKPGRQKLNVRWESQAAQPGTPPALSTPPVSPLAARRPEPVILHDQSTGFFSAAVGGIALAIISGILWEMIVIMTGYEIGWAAWGIGVLCGLGVVWLGGGHRGPVFQAIAVFASALGIFVGKYGTYFCDAKHKAALEGGAEAAHGVSYLSFQTIAQFLSNLPSELGIFDILWFFLAVGSAWRLTNENRSD